MCVCVGREGLGGGGGHRYNLGTGQSIILPTIEQGQYPAILTQAWPIKDLLLYGFTIDSACMGAWVTGNPKWARWLHLDHMSIQSEHRIHFILQAMQ